MRRTEDNVLLAIPPQVSCGCLPRKPTQKHDSLQKGQTCQQTDFQDKSIGNFLMSHCLQPSIEIVAGIGIVSDHLKSPLSG
jgi:hypothetical protein